jgi:hypothetical protein
MLKVTNGLQERRHGFKRRKSSDQRIKKHQCGQAVFVSNVALYDRQ